MSEGKDSEMEVDALRAEIDRLRRQRDLWVGKAQELRAEFNRRLNDLHASIEGAGRARGAAESEARDLRNRHMALEDEVTHLRSEVAAAERRGERGMSDKPCCPRCGSGRWVSVSLDGGFNRLAQCVPCGAYHKEVIGPGWQSPRYGDLSAEHPDYRKESA